MSDMLSIAASGLRAYHTALTTTSENIANAGTAGYVRRTSDVREVTATGVTNMNGMGVTAGGIVRQTDVYRAGQVRLATTDLGRSETSATWLERIQGALTGNKLGDQITNFFSSARTAAANPSALGPRQAVLEAAAGAAASFASTGNALDAALADLDATAEAAVGQLNGLSATLARVNFALGSVSPNTSSAASLLDQRDQLLEQMSAISDINVTLDSTGRATVRQGATGALFVQGVDSATVTYVRNSEGAVSYAAFMSGSMHTLTPAGGVLAGLAEGATAIANARGELNTVAQGFAQDVNTVQAAGDDLTGHAGQPMFTIGDPASNLTLAIADPRGIAGAGRGKGERDNGNFIALDAIRGESGAEQGITNLVTANGAALNARNSVVDAQSAIRSNAVMARDAVTGVNIDEEAVDLIRFQQAYQASGRVIQVARDVLQSVLDIR